MYVKTSDGKSKQYNTCNRVVRYQIFIVLNKLSTLNLK